jgi:tRNA (guanine37-N1)-methyltransferase
MKFVVLTIFPELIQAFWENGIMRRAIESGTISSLAINIRDHAPGRHRVTDDRPYGGGCGMVMKPEPLSAAIRQAQTVAPEAPVLLLSPQGKPFDQETAARLAGQKALILICGRYEGIDERVAEQFVDAEISIGDYVLTGGELPAMVVMDAVTRLIPGALGNEDSAGQDSFCDQRLDHAHYTRPPEFEGHTVPDVLLGGHHENIARWRQADALMKTLVKRPDLLREATLTRDEIRLLEIWRRDIESLIGKQDTRGADPPSGGR